MAELIRIQFSEFVEYDTRNKVENFVDITFNPMHIIFLLLGESVNVSNIVGKRMKGFSYDFEDMRNMTQRQKYDILGMLCLTEGIWEFESIFFILRC